MSRVDDLASVQVTGFPRVSGDEPAKAEALLVREQFSPRERG
mgnify:CR=1 FL=1